ncbi:uncharacterized protein BDZ99DRAFT_479618 [Mytilinidion resinicola]|uniref:Uncharacterized protein n=1 Tax=Mytilinidion resinicola TaxID=574789 RepID=A0A6A6YCQ9_9PEZI|nr:uncharacterized protein BDZ99DRAFT_479618 [Mytilinidion resinicola]KAF2806358.1 hypothetical protein BDZ99DRAFT_479618 [Mytilinidion resinicola]
MSGTDMASASVQPDASAEQASKVTDGPQSPTRHEINGPLTILGAATATGETTKQPGYGDERKTHYTAEEKEDFRDPERLVVLLAHIIKWGLDHNENDLCHLQHGVRGGGYYRMIGGDPRGPSEAIRDWAVGLPRTRRIVDGIVHFSTPPMPMMEFARSPGAINLAPIAAGDVARAIKKHPFNDTSPGNFLADLLCRDSAALRKHEARFRKMLHSAPHLLLKGATLCLVLLYHSADEIAQAVSLFGNGIAQSGIYNRIEGSLRMILDKDDVRKEQQTLLEGAYRMRKRLQDDTIPAPLDPQSLQTLAQSEEIPRNWF